MKKVYLFTLLTAMALSITACENEPSPKPIVVPNICNFELLDLSGEQRIHTSAQHEFTQYGDPDAFISTNDIPLGLGMFSNSKPQGVYFDWIVKPDKKVAPKYYNVNVYKKINGQSELVQSINEIENVYNATKQHDGSSIYLNNLEIGTTYEVEVKAQFERLSWTSYKRTFVTEAVAPRNMSVDGVENVRDLGGWKIANGKTVKQGLIYRSAELNGKEDGLSKVTEKGIETLKNVLKIKSDIDVREADELYGITSSPIGEDVNFVHLPMVYGHKNIFTNEENTENVKAFFEYLSVEENYPVMFHCVRGTDRTGALAYAINALCGVSESDLMKDYLFSDFANIGGTSVRRKDITGTSFHVAGIAAAEGNTYAEKTKNYLMDKVGIEAETLDKIVDILTD